MSSVRVSPMKACDGSSEKIVINVGGVKYETHTSTLMALPGSRLANLVDTNKPPSELFFDRNPEVFGHVLQYYRSGKLHCPTNFCGLLLEEEFAFWGVSGTDVEPCCWATFRQNKDTVEALAQIEPSVMEKEEGPGQNHQSRNSRAWMQKIWALFDHPYSSFTAKVIAIISLFFILLSFTAFSLQTEPNRYLSPFYILRTGNSTGKCMGTLLVDSLDVVELVCSVWFVFEFVMRVVSCPSKPRFFMNVMNIVDLLALFPWFSRCCSSMYCWKAMSFLHVMRCIRVFRIFKLMQHVFGVRVLNHALRASATSLCTLPLVFLICTLIFGTMFFLTEFENENAYFSDISSCFWWAVVTLTTVGYGDVLPISGPGKLVGSLCAMVGVLLIILPLPIIINNFIKFSSLLKTKYSMPRTKEKHIVDTAPSSSA
ncbi:potassium voltage-gated channel subfamily C member 1 [Carassius auratus]|uniref:Potassium voltage-gated channel subfamily C member 1 n=1 Tax=Carassius auratus TaxID=7957 RepID=A0A6P6NZT2_CARAU|nr:potassium voltage-gated channel subfamily C member 1-like [Carassius auratus]